MPQFNLALKNYTPLAGTTPVPDPNFPVITVTTRDRSYVTPTPVKTFEDRIDQLVALGQTDGVAYVYSDESSNQWVIYRNWIDTNIANEWLSFVTSVNDPVIIDNKLYT